MSTPSWTHAKWRRQAAALAEASEATLVEISCTAPPALAESRIEQRLQTGRAWSDATVLTAQRMAADANPWPSAYPVDTTAGPDEAVRAALQVVAPEVAAKGTKDPGGGAV